MAARGWRFCAADAPLTARSRALKGRFRRAKAPAHLGRDAPLTARSRALKEAITGDWKGAWFRCTPYGSLESTERAVRNPLQHGVHGCTPYGSLESTERLSGPDEVLHYFRCTPYGSLESTEREELAELRTEAMKMHPLRLAREH